MTARQKSLLLVLVFAAVAGGLGVLAYRELGQVRSERIAATEEPSPLFPRAASAPDAGGAAGLSFTSITLEQYGGERTVLEQHEGVWNVTFPGKARADRTRMLSLLDALQGARLSAAIIEAPSDEELERLGLKPPRTLVTARTREPEARDGGGEPSRERVVTFQVGGENLYDGSVYVRREGDPRVYLAPGKLRVALAADSWRSAEVFDVEERVLRRIEVKGRQGAWVLERDTVDKPWRMTRPMAMPVDPKRVERMFKELKIYKAQLYPEKEWEPEVLRALEKPQVDVTLVPEAGAPVRFQLVEVSIEGTPRTFVRTQGTDAPKLVQVDSNTLTVLDPSPQEFKSTKVLAFRTAEVTGILIHPGGGGDPLSLRRTPDASQWEVVSPVTGKAQAFKVASLLNALETLEAETVVATGPKAAARHGITDSSRSVSLLDARGEPLARLSIGNSPPDHADRTWVRGSSEDISELSTAALDALPLTPEELLAGAAGAGP